ncbi:MAG TPA: D-glucuronyl C5-epimerase family protein [Thermoleophilaceae bacterium]|nr:D-glucuronyl C5-epimerase family protein [Thermoleophilaceae bacterium]
MRQNPRTIALAVAAALLAAAPAQAGEVILVDGERAVRASDPAVPSEREVSLGMPVGGPGPVGIAAARSDREARAARRAWQRARGAPPKKRTKKRADRRAVYAALRRVQQKGSVEEADQRRWRTWYVRSLRTYGKLRGARRDQLGYVIDSVEALALSKRLGVSRMPAAFVQLERNRRYWRSLPYPGAGDQVSFEGSEILYQYFPGEGLQLHPLSTFKKANHMFGACQSGSASCDEAALRLLLDEMTALAVRRSSRFIAWEYAFHFGGGSPPWISGMAQATGLQAYARAAALLSEPAYVETARAGLGAFEARPPRGVRTAGPGGGVHYLQYSFAPRLYVFNAFLQSLIGLHDLGKLAGEQRATGLYQQAEPEARAEVPLSDVGDWSRYSYRGAESSPDYHELLRELLASMCTRRLGALYCDYAERYRGYQVDPPELTYAGPEGAVVDEPTAIRFELSKLSAVEVKVLRGSKVVFSRVATFRRGSGSFTFRPGAPGSLTVQLAAKELRTGLGKRDRATGQLEVQPAKSL